MIFSSNPYQRDNIKRLLERYDKIYNFTQSQLRLMEIIRPRYPIFDKNFSSQARQSLNICGLNLAKYLMPAHTRWDRQDHFDEYDWFKAGLCVAALVVWYRDLEDEPSISNRPPILVGSDLIQKIPLLQEAQDWGVHIER